MRVGVAGLGRMGAAIAARLIEVGHEVTVWNRTPDKAKPLAAAGAKVAQPRRPSLRPQVEAIVTILTNQRGHRRRLRGRRRACSPATSRASSSST